MLPIPDHLKNLAWYAAHLAWARAIGYIINHEPGDAQAKRADLKGADLQGAYLQGAYLQGAYLKGADLQGAYLKGAYLKGADLQGADLQGADLQGAYLKGADLQGADLQGAYLKGAYLTNAKLDNVNVEGAKGILPEGHDPLKLRLAVADQIEAHPELHNQSEWGKGDPNECGTACCVAGWACRLGGGTMGLGVSEAAALLLAAPGKLVPNFGAFTNRKTIIDILRD